MKRVYEPIAYGLDPIKDCFWTTTVQKQSWPTLDSDLSCDVVIIGAGYTGISAAYHLAQDGLDVCLIDAQYPAFGASGRNGGFCCLGGTMADDRVLDHRYGKDGRRAYHACEAAAVDLVQSLIGDLHLNVDRHSKGETIMAHRPKDAKSLSQPDLSCQENYSVSSIYHDQDELRQLGLHAGFHGARTLPIGFGLNPQKYAYGLLSAAQSLGVRVFANSPAQAIDGSTVSANGHQLKAQKIIIATNGYSSEDLVPWMRSRFMPVQSSVLVTRPMSQEELDAQGWTSDQMAYDTRNMLHYFRLMPDRRFLFGMRGGIFATPKAEAKIKREIRSNFEMLFPKWSQVETEHYWSGLVCLTRSYLPYVGPIPNKNSIFTGFGYHGNGVAMATYSGLILADLVQGKTPRVPYPAALKTIPKRFPLGRFRRQLLRPAYAMMQMLDR